MKISSRNSVSGPRVFLFFILGVREQKKVGNRCHQWYWRILDPIDLETFGIQIHHHFFHSFSANFLAKKYKVEIQENIYRKKLLINVGEINTSFTPWSSNNLIFNRFWEQLIGWVKNWIYSAGLTLEKRFGQTSATNKARKSTDLTNLYLDM